MVIASKTTRPNYLFSGGLASSTRIPQEWLARPFHFNVNQKSVFQNQLPFDKDERALL
jgi:hypothetical protein